MKRVKDIPRDLETVRLGLMAIRQQMDEIPPDQIAPEDFGEWIDAKNHLYSASETLFRAIQMINNFDSDLKDIVVRD